MTATKLMETLMTSGLTSSLGGVGVGLGLAGAAGGWLESAASAGIGSSALAFSAAAASLTLAKARRRRQERRSIDPPDTSKPDAAATTLRRSVTAEQSPSEEQVVGCATSLLSLQEAGRQIATHSDFDTLVPTVITTARSALRCRYAAVYFWDAVAGTLTASLPPRERDSDRFVPDPATGMTRWVIETRQVWAASAAESNPELPEFSGDGGRLPAGLAPLLVGNELLGLLVVDEPEQSDDPSFGRMLYILANLAALGLKNAQLFRKMEESARRDPLTGLLNRCGLDAAVETLIDRAKSGRPLTLILSDLDRFKQLNDQHGHLAGDTVLREAARVWRTVLPEEAVVARYGGEEFLAILPDRALGQAEELAEELRGLLAAHPFRHDGRLLSVTASFGLSEFAGEDADLDEMLRRADRALYRAKAEGRNRVCIGETFAATR